jgi:hypothetical protein
MRATLRRAVEAALAAIDVTELVRVHVDLDALAAGIDVDARVARADVDADLDRIASRIDLDAIMQRVERDAVIRGDERRRLVAVSSTVLRRRHPQGAMTP